MTISLAVPDILVARAKSGDLEALEALYRAFETPVYNVALRVLRRPEDAEDVLQETFGMTRCGKRTSSMMSGRGGAGGRGRAPWLEQGQ